MTVETMAAKSVDPLVVMLVVLKADSSEETKGKSTVEKTATHWETSLDSWSMLYSVDWMERT